MRYAAKVDNGHKLIRDSLRTAGVFVLDGSKWGDGAPDLLCYSPNTGWVPLEIKTRRTDYRARNVQKLTAAQTKLHLQAPIAIVETVNEALALFGFGHG